MDREDEDVDRQNWNSFVQQQKWRDEIFVFRCVICDFDNIFYTISKQVGEILSGKRRERVRRGHQKQDNNLQHRMWQVDRLADQLGLDSIGTMNTRRCCRRRDPCGVVIISDEEEVVSTHRLRRRMRMMINKPIPSCKLNLKCTKYFNSRSKVQNKNKIRNETTTFLFDFD